MATPIGNGTYVARAMEWELGLSSGNKERVRLRFEIMEGEYAGRSLHWNGYLTDRAVANTMKALRVCGWKTDDIGWLEGVQDNLVNIVVELKQGTDGKMYPEIRWVNSLMGALKSDKPLDANQRSMLVARMKLYAKQAPLVPGVPARTHDRAITEDRHGEEDATNPGTGGTEDDGGGEAPF